MTVKKKISTAIISILLIGVVLAVVLLGVYFGTRNTKNGADYFADYYEVPIEIYPEDKQITVDRNETYLGHPDLVYNDAGELITMYPLSHGKGQLAMQKSADDGKTWSGRIREIPASWTNSQETPTLYNLRFTDGSTKLLLVSGCPTWNEDIRKNGFNCSVSTDGGRTWSEFENFYGIDWGEANGKPAYDGIVAMSSLTQVKENGRWTNRWLGTFHDHGFTNYKTYLTFDAAGNIRWTEPAPLLPEKYHGIEAKTQMCELEIVRTPSADGSALSGDTLILLARANAHKTNSMIAYSDDEGETWTEPKELPYCLTGERHKAEYDPASGKLAISFRSYREEKESALSVKPKKRTLGWVSWIGDFDDLLSYRDADEANDAYGDKVLVLGTDYRYTGDCGYAGTALDPEGYFVMISYGRFSKDANNPYIMATRFKVAEDGTVSA